jgi:hypothetical protein
MQKIRLKNKAEPLEDFLDYGKEVKSTRLAKAGTQINHHPI